MAAEVVLCSSGKESGGGLAVLDVHRAGASVASFKNSVSDAHCLCLVGGGSSYSGLGSGGDFIVASQSKKPVLNVYMWGKPQVHQQCHIQEITTALACDATGTYLLGGTKKGWVYCWEVATGQLVTSWQAHFKAVTKILFTPCGHFAVSCSEDGMARAWDVAAVLATDSSGGGGGGGDKKKTAAVPPYRSWSPHTLSVKDACLCGGLSSVRVVTVSLDRTVVLFDLHANKQCFRAALPHPLESLCASRTADLLFLGASSGQIFELDVSAAALGLSAAHAQALSTSRATSGGQPGVLVGLDTSSGGGGGGGGSKGYPVLEGHSRAVTALACSVDNCTLVSASEDGSVRVWDVWTRQCLRESKPLQRAAVTGLLLASKPEVLSGAVHKPSLAPMEHLKKYPESGAGGAAVGTGDVLPPRVFGGFWGVPLASEGATVCSDLPPASFGSTGQAEARAEAEADGDADADAESEVFSAPRRPASAGAGAAEEEDFLSFSPEPQPPSKAQKSDVDELRRRVAELESDNARWKAVSAGLKRKLGE